MSGNAKQLTKNKLFKGLAISSGKINARVCVYSLNRHKQISIHTLTSDKEINAEIKRFETALIHCTNDLDKIITIVKSEIGKAEAEIFIAQKHIMNDPLIITAITNEVKKEKKNIETIITKILSSFEDRFKNIDNEYLSERSSDIGEIRRRLLDYLSQTGPGFVCKGQSKCEKDEERVVVAEALSASMIVNMNPNRIHAIVTEHGGSTSHAAIIARSVGIPAVSGIKNIYNHVICGDSIIVDGDAGEVIVNPYKRTISQYFPKKQITKNEVCHLTSPKGMKVFANAGLLDDVKYAMKIKADGIGLFRTELSFIFAGRLLSEDEQYQLYKNVQSIMKDKPVVFRLLDIGGDKELPFLNIEKESNPFMGLRGVRFLLENKEVFTNQMRALVRMSHHGKVRILFPMVIDSYQLKKIIKACRAIITLVDSKPENIELGVMFEVPGACLEAAKILKTVDFGSIGSNDLIQHLFAVDRSNEAVSQDYNPEHPVLWKLLRNLSTVAKELDKPLSFCGEMAGRQGIPSRLLDIGINAISVSSRLVQRVRSEMVDYSNT